jgi:hypothetical protein
MRLNDDDCVICRDWPDVIRPATLRANAMRIAVDSLPLKKAEHICDECLEAFWNNCCAKRKPPSKS